MRLIPRNPVSLAIESGGPSMPVWLRQSAPIALAIGVLALLLCACTGPVSVITPTSTPSRPTLAPSATVPAPATATAQASATSTLTAQPTATPFPTETATAVPPTSPPTASPTPVDWTTLPIIPTLSATVREIYQRGQALGNDPHAFSKVGDCESSPNWFLGDFDQGPRYYRLGEYTYLDTVIQQYAGSFGRTSLAAKPGFSTGSMLDPDWSDPKQCKRKETPLACEFRVHKPSLVFIMLGTNDVYHLDVFETNLRTIIDYALEHGVIPILSTKADNLEGHGRVNALVARLAHDYHLPLWNFWLAIQPLPNQGLQPDGVHITWKPNRFDDPVAMTYGWPVRNLTALQTLNAVWEAVK
jgi:GDSL-like Lipase/Acylhydrolase family